MKVIEIIETVDKLLDLNLSKNCYSTDKQVATYELQTNKTLRLILECINYCLDDIACDYSPNVAVETIVCTDGFASISTLSQPLLEVIRLQDKCGSIVKYRYAVGGLLCASDGTFDITYTSRYEEVNLDSEFFIANNKIDKRIFSYGVCSEYCLLTNDYETMSVWDSRYKNCLLSATHKSSEKKMPVRGWY